MKQFYPMTLPDAIARYQRGEVTARGLVHLYLQIKTSKGEVLAKSAKEVCSELGIQKSAFCNAISKLKADGLINWEIEADTEFCISLPISHQEIIREK